MDQGKMERKDVGTTANGAERRPAGRKRLFSLLLMHGLFLVYSMSTVISRAIGDAPLFSAKWIGGYLLVFLCLGIYALGWQQVLKAFSLSTAYTNKAVVVIWGLVWGFLFFGEAITPRKLMGAGLIIAGVVLFASAEKAPDGGTEA